MTTRNQHYVWRYYLGAWQNANGLVHCSIKGKILPPTNPKNLMVERDFYKLTHFTASDLVFLKSFIERTGTEQMKQLHQNLVCSFARIAQANELIQNDNSFTIEEKKAVQALAIETEDKIQGQIELHAKPILAELRKRQTDFFNCDEKAIAFFRFISHQYFRTKHIREVIGDAPVQFSPNHDFSRVANVVCHIAAENVGSTLYRDRREFEIVFMDNKSPIGFVTGDQPIINLLGTENGSDPKEIIFYYPLSPALSCILSPKEYNLCASEFTSKITDDLNDLVVWQSKHFLVANSAKTLEHVLSRTSSTKLPAYHILDSLAEKA